MFGTDCVELLENCDENFCSDFPSVWLHSALKSEIGECEIYGRHNDCILL